MWRADRIRAPVRSRYPGAAEAGRAPPRCLPRTEVHTPPIGSGSRYDTPRYGTVAASAHAIVHRSWSDRLMHESRSGPAYGRSACAIGPTEGTLVEGRESVTGTWFRG